MYLKFDKGLRLHDFRGTNLMDFPLIELIFKSCYYIDLHFLLKIKKNLSFIT